jgi:hypothetical protein
LRLGRNEQLRVRLDGLWRSRSSVLLLGSGGAKSSRSSVGNLKHGLQNVKQKLA